MTEIRSAAVIGLGLIGGSLARELTSLGVRVLGGDRDTDAVRAALRDGEIRAALGPRLDGIGDADVLVLAVPVGVAADVLRSIRPQLGGVRLITDVGSTKRSIGEAAEALGIGDRFVGSHPLAGDHRSGWAASRRGLFQGARVCLSPGPSTNPGALTLARKLWMAVGAEPEVVDSAEHDRRLAWSSHLPQTLASALARSLDCAGVSAAELGPGGSDMTRLAGSSAEMWTSIALDNRQNLLAALAAAEAELGVLRTALVAGDEARVHRFFTAAAEWRQGVSRTPGQAILGSGGEQQV